MLEDFHSPFDATVVSLLSASGAEIVGKANCDEFGMGSLNFYSAHGPVVNPFGLQADGHAERRSAGGSSGGSAAAVATQLCDACMKDSALGTDTGGSVRLPASYCGIVGLKPSYGIISRTLNQGHLENLKGDSLAGLRVGVPQEYFPTELQPSIVTPVRAILDQLRARGATIVPVSLPSTPYALSAYYVISSAEASSNLARYDGIEYGMRVEPPPGANLTKTANVYAYTRSQGFGKEVQRRMLLGTYALSAEAFENYFLQAQRVRKLIKADFDRVFCIPSALNAPSTDPVDSAEGVHVLIHPSAIQTAPALPDNEGRSQEDGASTLDAYVQDVMTVPASLAGLPALNVPAGNGADGWPIGVSVVGQWGSDDLVLRVGEVIERCREDI
uniref:MADS-box MEF2 type transcription factor n=1 Tax=Ganoderma boninense TaxID=34458 RepID=A0A5K1K980_9APHY|nr:MADS-box MEF2 type transcription factor [Ganoderma boninense]